MDQSIWEQWKIWLIQSKQDGANITHSTPTRLQRAGAHLQARVEGEFRALHQILQEEETRLLEQLRKEQVEELEKVQHHLEAAELAMRELEENIRMLQKASDAAENTLLTEVKAQLSVASKLHMHCSWIKHKMLSAVVWASIVYSDYFSFISL